MADFKPTEPTKETKKAYIFNYTGDDAVNLTALNLTKKKPLIVTLNNTDNSSHYFNSSYNYSETVTVKSGYYNMSLQGVNSNKTITLGDVSYNTVSIRNVGKNKITAGNGKNTFITYSAYANSSITAGTEKDTYWLHEGKTQITDKGGADQYTISGGMNTITDKGGANTYTIRGGINKITDKGSEGSTYTFNIVGQSDGGSEGGVTTIKSGDGIDRLFINNDFAPDTDEILINADLGKGDDVVYVDYKEDSLHNTDSSVLNLKTGKGEDQVDISAGIKNTINTGDGSDKVRIRGGKNNIINTGNDDDEIMVFDTAVNTTSIIKAGKGDDEIDTNGGINTIYGESGKDEITLWSGTNTVYGGGDKITTKNDSSNTIYASADNINLMGGTSTIYVKKGKNEIYANGGTNEIHLVKGKNTIVLTNGNNIVYGSGKETIKTNGTAGTNTIYTYGDTVNLYSGTNEIHTLKGNSTINVLSSETFTANDDNVIYLDKGNNTVNLSGGQESSYTDVKIRISSGKNTINLDEYTTLELSSSDTLRTTQKINIKGHAYAQLDLGDVADIIKDSSDVTVPSGWEMRSGGGNDKYYISNGSNKVMRGGDGNDYFEITNGSGYEIYGNRDNDTITLKSGDAHSVFGGDGNDTINVNGGTNYYIKGEAGEDIFNITGGSGAKIYGGEGNDIFNIKGGVTNFIYGDNGDDIYNLNMKSGLAIIDDDAGKNTVNVAKNFKGSASVMESGTAEIDLVFDKSYKLTTRANVKNGVIKTNDSNVTLYRNFSKTGDFVEGWGMQLITNVKDEISDKSINGRFIDIGYGAGTPNINVGGKKYTLNLDQLKSDLATWFSTRSYDDSQAVFKSKNEADINSLMAVYTKDTAGCFVKA